MAQTTVKEQINTIKRQEGWKTDRLSSVGNTLCVCEGEYVREKFPCFLDKALSRPTRKMICIAIVVTLNLEDLWQVKLLSQDDTEKQIKISVRLLTHSPDLDENLPRRQHFNN